MKFPVAVFVSLDWNVAVVGVCAFVSPRSSWMYGSKAPFADWMPNFDSSRL